MARRGGNPRVSIQGDADGVKRASKDAETSLGRLEQSGKKSLSGLKTAAIATGAALAGGLVIATKEAAEAAIESEKAMARMQSQLNALGISYSDHEKQIQRVIDKHSQLSGFDDEDLGDSFTNIVRVVGDVNKALDLNVIAMDFARAKNIDVAKAGELVGKVAGGNTGILSRYGVQIEKGATATEALGKLQELFAGQAKEYGETTAGSADRAKVAFENLGETLGAKVTPMIADAADAFSNLIREYTLGQGPGGRIRSVVEGVGTAARDSFGFIRGLVDGFRDGEGPARLFAAGVGAVAASFVAFKVGGVVVAGIDATRTAWNKFAGPEGALTKNPLGLAALAVTGLITALGILSSKTRDNEASARAFNDALRAQRDAMREVADIELDEAQRKANLRSANVAVEQAEKNLAAVRKEHGKNSLEAKQAEADLRQARLSQRRAAVDVARAEDDAKRKREDARDATKKLSDEERKLNGDIDKNIRDREKEIRGIDDSIRAVKEQGGNNDATRKTVEKLREQQRKLRNEINSLKSKKVDVEVKFKLTPAPGSSFGSMDVGDGIGRAVKSSVTKLAQQGFSSGALMPMGPGNLMGADFDLGPFAALAAGQGLSVTSGLRPGAVTSSGRPSYHATGDAIDVAGPKGAMLRFFQMVKSMFGSRLRELIYTPGGAGILNGRSHTFTGKVADDHHDHVHVAYTGPFGDGLGKFSATSYGPPWGGINGTGVTATGVNLKGGPKRYGVAVDPKVIPLGSMLKINPNPFGYGGLFEAFDTGGAIKGRRIDFYDWRGRKSQLGWGSRTVTISTAGDRRTTRSGGGGISVDGGSSRERLIGPGEGGHEQRIADVGVEEAQARRSDNLPKLIASMAKKRNLLRKRLKRINRLLRRKQPKDFRLQLTQERASIIEEIGDLNESLKEYRADRDVGATTISRAEELDAGVDTSAGGGGTSGGGDDSGVAAAVAELAAVIRQQIERNDYLVKTQGPSIVNAVIAAVNGGIGGSVGLGFQGIRSPAGSVAGL